MNGLGVLNIEKVIIHQILKADSGDKKFISVKFNNFLTLATTAKTLLGRRIQGVTNKTTELEYESDGVYQSLKSVIGEGKSDDDLIVLFDSITDQLVEVQDRRVSDSVMFYIVGTFGVSNEDFVCLVKAEFDQSFELTTGDTEAELRIIENAFLGSEKKLYKLAFLSSSMKSINRISVYDSNLTQFRFTGLAKYFFSDFLGCKMPEDSKRKVEPFYNNTRRFINRLSDSVERKMIYYNTLVSYLQSETNRVVSIADFADLCFGDSKISDEYEESMKEIGFMRDSVLKNLEFTRAFLSSTKSRIQFDTKISLVYTPEQRNYIEVLDENDDYITLRIKGKVEGI